MAELFEQRYLLIIPDNEAGGWENEPPEDSPYFGLPEDEWFHNFAWEVRYRSEALPLTPKHFLLIKEAIHHGYDEGDNFEKALVGKEWRLTSVKHTPDCWAEQIWVSMADGTLAAITTSLFTHQFWCSRDPAKRLREMDSMFGVGHRWYQENYQPYPVKDDWELVFKTM